MEKKQESNINSTNDIAENTEAENQNELKSDSQIMEEEEKVTPEDKIKELEDKLARTFADMENQRRRFEKEKEDAFEYGGSLFAKEALNLIDNLERSKQILKDL